MAGTQWINRLFYRAGVLTVPTGMVTCPKESEASEWEQGQVTLPKQRSGIRGFARGRPRRRFIWPRGLFTRIDWGYWDRRTASV
jgi:hypothetical protein